MSGTRQPPGGPRAASRPRFATTRDPRRRAVAYGFVAILSFPVPSLALADPPAGSRAEAPHVAVELVAENTWVEPRRAFRAGVRFQLEDGWHVYWKNPGDSGLPPRIQWSLPPGFAAGPIAWPRPERIELGPLVDYGYSREVLLASRITSAADAADPESLVLATRVEWLVCKEDCLPGEADLRLSLPVRAGDPPRDPRWAAAFADADARAPRSADAIALEARAAADRVSLVVPLAAGASAQTGEILFYPADPGWIENAAPQTVEIVDGSAHLRLPRSAQPHEMPPRLRGVLESRIAFAGGPPGAVEVDTPVLAAAASSNGASAGLATGPVGSAFERDGMNLPLALLFAFAGGLILNLMPCVFPVLSLKILDFARQSGGAPARIRAHGFAYAGGVVVSFWILAGVLLALRAGGEALGWGFQLQSPTFVVVLAFVLCAIALGLLGGVEVGVGLTGVAGRWAGGGGLSGSFATGALATVLATPCTAPFMGAAVGFALALPAAGALAVFTALGAGMATPYVALCLAPGWLARLPRPGAWMEALRQWMAFPLLATVGWLIWVLAVQGGVDVLPGVLGGLLLLGLGVWMLGRAARAVGSARRGRTTRLAALVAAGLGLAIALGSPGAEGPPRGASAAADGPWERFSVDRLDRLRAAGRPVFVDFTAAWCLTCKVNERVVLDTEAVQRAFADRGVVLLRADWTTRDPEISRVLEVFGRSGVPLYLLYPDQPDAPPAVLPSLLTRSIVLDAIDRKPS